MPKEAAGLLRLCREELKLDIAGLMCIPPHDEEAAVHFAFLAKLAGELGLADLSMGMSADFETAIAFGATYVRVGSQIFGDASHVIPAERASALSRDPERHDRPESRIRAARSVRDDKPRHSQLSAGADPRLPKSAVLTSRGLIRAILCLRAGALCGRQAAWQTEAGRPRSKPTQRPPRQPREARAEVLERAAKIEKRRHAGPQTKAAQAQGRRAARSRSTPSSSSTSGSRPSTRSSSASTSTAATAPSRASSPPTWISSPR